MLIGVAVFAFLLGTPYALISTEEFQRDLLFEGGTKFGIITPFHLLSLLAISQSTLLLIITLIGLLLVLLRVKRWQPQFLLLWLLAGMTQRLISDADLARYLIATLPPLAVFAGVALNKARELIAGLNLRWSQAWGWALSLILLAPAIGYSLNIVWILQGTDVRNDVAGWLESHVTTDEPIGILANFYYDMPPINADLYEIVNVAEMDLDHMPAVIVLTSENKFYLPQGVPESFSAQTFSQRPLPWWTWPITTLPHDWGYTFLDVTVYADSDRISLN